MGPGWIRHSSHHFATRSSHSVDLAGCQAKMASIEIWIPWRNAHKPYYQSDNAHSLLKEVMNFCFSLQMGVCVTCWRCPVLLLRIWTVSRRRLARMNSAKDKFATFTHWHFWKPFFLRLWRPRWKHVWVSEIELHPSLWTLVCIRHTGTHAQGAHTM